MVAALSLLALSIACYSVSQLLQHGKFKWMSKDRLGFWGEDMDERKYKDFRNDGRLIAPKNFYYKHIARVPYVERWFTSTNVTVMFTDSYHLLQHLSFVLMACAFSLKSGVNFLIPLGVILGTHFAVYFLTQKR